MTRTWHGRGFEWDIAFVNPGRTHMLILTRRVGETINIGDDIVVTVLGVKGNQVRIGVSAPREVRVDREEIRERIKAEEAQAARAAPVVPVKATSKAASRRIGGWAQRESVPTLEVY